jgi:hypothetical protein
MFLNSRFPLIVLLHIQFFAFILENPFMYTTYFLEYYLCLEDLYDG